MKKAKSGQDGVAAVEAYLAKVPEPHRTTLEKVRATIRAAAPAGAEECISYSDAGIPLQGRAGGVCGIQEALQLLSHELGNAG